MSNTIKTRLARCLCVYLLTWPLNANHTSGLDKASPCTVRGEAPCQVWLRCDKGDMRR